MDKKILKTEAKSEAVKVEKDKTEAVQPKKKGKPAKKEKLIEKTEKPVEKEVEKTVEDEKKPTYFKKQDSRRRIVRGKAFIKCSYNNTTVTIADLNGAVLGWATAGSLGFRGAKKATPYAATLVAAKVVENTAKTGLREVDVFVKGVGGGREAAVRALGNNGLKVNSIKDTTPVPHNGCRSKKMRRV